MRADGTDEQRVTTNDALDEGPVWSPDGRSLVFGTRRDGNEEIYVMAADGSAPRRLTVDDGTQESPDWQAVPAAPPAPGTEPDPATGSSTAPALTPSPATAPRLGLLTSRPRVSRTGRLVLTIRCPRRCAGSVVLRRGAGVLARGSFRRAAPARLAVPLRLGPNTLRALRRAGTLRATAVVSAAGLEPSRRVIVLRYA